MYEKKTLQIQIDLKSLSNLKPTELLWPVSNKRLFLYTINIKHGCCMPKGYNFMVHSHFIDNS